MKKIMLVCLVFLCFLPIFAARMVIRITAPVDSLYEWYYEQDADIAAYRSGEYLDLVVSDRELPVYNQRHPGLIITQTEERLKANLSSRFRDIPGYRTYQQVMQELMNLQAQYPSLMTTEVIGEGWGAEYSQSYPAYSAFNHQIWAVKISANVNQEEDEPAIYFCGAHHAREPISVEVSMAILIYLLENYNTDPFVTNLLNTTQIWIVPLVNPDGHKVVLDQTDVWWRKNIRDNNNNHSIDTDEWGAGDDGVDINRNYGYNWGYISASDNINSVTYHGPGPFSEPETQAFKNFLESKRFIAGISYHTYGQYVLYPFGYMKNLYAPDVVELEALATAVAGVISGQNGGYYDPMPSWELYPVSGGLDDWAYGTLGTFAYTIEMAEEFIPTAAYVPQIVQNNLNAALLFLSRRNRAAFTGNITDIATGEPLEAIIHVEGIDDNPLPRAPYRSNQDWGRYFRFLSPGTYTVHYRLVGYAEETRTVVITDTDVTVQDIALTPETASQVAIRILEDSNPSMPIQGVSLTIADTEQVYTSNAEGVILIPDLVPGNYNVTISKLGYNTLKGWKELVNGYNYSLTQAPGYYEDFESGLGNWDVNGSWQRTNSQSYQGAYSLSDSPNGNYNNNLDTNCRLFIPIDLSAAQDVNLQFYCRYNIALDGDYAALEYSTNYTLWQALDFYNGQSDWSLKSYDLSGLSGNQLYLRFRISTNSSGRADGIFIDDLKLFISYYEPTSSSDETATPASITAYPNPSNGSVTMQIERDKPSTSLAELMIYNIRGQLVYSLPGIDQSTVKQSLSWNGLDNNNRAVGSGIYFLRLNEAGKTLATKRIVIINQEN